MRRVASNAPRNPSVLKCTVCVYCACTSEWTRPVPRGGRRPRPRETMTAPGATAGFAESLRQAHAALRAGRAATAESWLRALDAQFPGEANCLWLLGAALLDQNKIPESIAMLEEL